MVEVEAVVIIREETGLAIVTTLDDVKRDTGEGDAGAARHGRVLAK